MPGGHYGGGGGGGGRGGGFGGGGRMGGGGGGRLGGGGSRSAGQEGKAPRAGLLVLFRESWPFVKPQRWLLLFGFGLMAINRVAGLVLPASTKYLVDNIAIGKQWQLVVPLALAIVTATAVQGITSYSLTQLLSKAAQRMIADPRKQV